MAPSFTIVGLGEALFDIFPSRQVMGGAPLNVAYHAHQLAQRVGGRGVVVSRVGQDDLGALIDQQLQSQGLTTDFIQHDPDHSTGKVYVELSSTGEPSYEIVRDVAWDWLSFDPDMQSLVGQCQAVCFGSLAQREGQSRNTIYRFLETAHRAFRLFDVNLRQNYYDRRIIQRSIESATALKLNHHELQTLASLLGLESAGNADPLEHYATRLLRRFKLKYVAVTRGAKGTVIFDATGETQGTPVSYPMAANADAVGAGDACSAGLLVGSVLRWPLERIVKLADHAGAYVASQPGATPKLPDEILAMVG